MKILYISPQEKGKEDIPPFEFMNIFGLPVEYEVRLFDENSQVNLFNNLKLNTIQYNPDIIFFLGKSIKSYKKIKEYSLLLDSLNKPQVLIGDLSVAYDSILKNTGIDAVIRKGFELFTPQKILAQYEQSKKEFSVNNLFLRDKYGKVLFTGIKQEEFDFDKVPFPNYDLINMNYYLNKLKRNNYSSFEIFSSIGCTGLCTFCINRVSRVKRHSIEYVLDQMSYLKERYGVNFINFGDPSFTSDLNWTKKFIRELGRRDLNISYKIYGARTDQVNKEILQGLKNTGCKSIYFGFESASQNQLVSIKKNVSVEQNLEALLVAKELGIETPIQIITGLPNEDIAELKTTISILKINGFKVSKDKVRLLLPQPNTPIYSQFFSNGVIKNEEEYLLSLSDLDTRNIWRPELNSHLENIIMEINS